MHFFDEKQRVVFVCRHQNVVVSESHQTVKLRLSAWVDRLFTQKVALRFF